MGTVGWGSLLPVLDACAAALDHIGGSCWLVGGCLRDVLLGHTPYDVDLVVTCDPLRLAHEMVLAGGQAVDIARLAAARDTVRLTLHGAVPQPRWQLDLTRMRVDSIEADLVMRDFTMNALALPLAQRAAPRAWKVDTLASEDRGAVALIDPTGGLGDLRARVLRVASAHALADDPLRVLRGARLAACLDLTLDATTVELARAASVGLPVVVRARVGEELRAMLALHQPAQCQSLEHLRTFGAVAVLLPELTGARLDHALATLAAVDAAREAILRRVPARQRTRVRYGLDAWCDQPLAAGRTRAIALRWAALLHGLDGHDRPPDAREGEWETPALSGVGARFALAGRELRMVRDVLVHQRAAWALAWDDGDAGEAQAPKPRQSGAATLRAARHWFARTGEAGVATLLIAVACAQATLADTRSGVRGSALARQSALTQRAARLLSRFLLAREQVVPPPLLDGGIVMRELGLSAGPALGRVLAHVRAAQLDGVVRTPAQALRLARAMGAPLADHAGADHADHADR